VQQLQRNCEFQHTQPEQRPVQFVRDGHELGVVVRAVVGIVRRLVGIDVLVRKFQFRW